MGNDVKESILTEISKIDDLINFIKPLLKMGKSKEFVQIELIAIAMTLHSFYNGLERISSLFLDKFNDFIPSDSQWHKTLLKVMFGLNSKNINFIRSDLQNTVENYLSFRHLVRNIYCTELVWDRMKMLAENLEETWTMIKSDFESLLERSL